MGLMVLPNSPNCGVTEGSRFWRARIQSTVLPARIVCSLPTWAADHDAAWCSVLPDLQASSQSSSSPQSRDLLSSQTLCSPCWLGIWFWMRVQDGFSFPFIVLKEKSYFWSSDTHASAIPASLRVCSDSPCVFSFSVRHSAWLPSQCCRCFCISECRIKELCGEQMLAPLLTQ